MGVTLYFKGQFKNTLHLQVFINQVIIFSESNSWEYFTLETNFPNDSFTEEDILPFLYGIVIKIPKVDPLMFTFLSNGKLCSLIDFNLWLEGKAELPKENFVFCKTQFSDYQTHQKIVHFIKEVASLFFEKFECRDDTNYYINENIDELIEIFEHNKHLIDGFNDFLSNGTKSNDDELNIKFEEALNCIKNSLQDIKEDNEPELTIEDQIRYKKMKIAIENEGMCFNSNSSLPPEIENQFLDNVISFENAFKKNEQIKIFEILGCPNFPKYGELLPNEVEEKVLALEQLLHKNGIQVDFLYEYKNEVELFYKLVTEKLFDYEIMNLKGFFTNFIYEEFYPNDFEDLKKDVIDFFDDFFDEDPIFFNSDDINNIEEIKIFRKLFSQVKCIQLDILKVEYDDINGNVDLDLCFEAIIENTNENIKYEGKAYFKFEKKYDYWYLVNVKLPI
jgi:hypothetical protein